MFDAAFLDIMKHLSIEIDLKPENKKSFVSKRTQMSPWNYLQITFSSQDPVRGPFLDHSLFSLCVQNQVRYFTDNLKKNRIHFLHHILTWIVKGFSYVILLWIRSVCTPLLKVLEDSVNVDRWHLFMSYQKTHMYFNL